MYKKIIIMCISVLLLTGCSDKYFICTTDITNSDMNYSLNAKYKVYYKKNYVTKIEKKEIYISEDKSVIKYFNDYKNIQLNNFNDLYGGFIYNINMKGKQVEIKTIIDLSVSDIKKMVKNNYLNEDYVIGNKLTTTGAKYYYQGRGAICE